MPDNTLIMGHLSERPWLITGGWLRDMHAIAAREHDLLAAAEKIRATSARREAALTLRGPILAGTRSVEMIGPVAIIPVTGPVIPYANIFSQVSGATSIEMFTADFRAALGSQDVAGIIVCYDTPGGYTAGISEAAQLIFDSRTVKPVASFVSDAALSAGYWLCSAGGEIVMPPTAMVGSVGTVIALRKSGQDTNTIEIVSSTSPRKRLDPESPDGRAHWQNAADAIQSVFVSTVARNRGVSEDQVLSDFGRGGVVVGRQAVDLGMADRIGTLESVVNAITGPKIFSIGGSPMNSSETGEGGLHAVTAASIAARHPDIASELRGEGAKAERERIQAVLSIAAPGKEALLRKLALEDCATEGAAALAVLAAEQQERKAALAAMTADAQAIPPVNTTSGGGDDGNAAAEKAAVATIAAAGSK